ncbi:MAG: helix-turn-helix domain-containing protein [Patescibacteria group bacterium]
MLDEKQKSKLSKNLTSLGLSEKESLVYLALIELGEVGSSKIIIHTGLHGQYVYDALNKLEEKGLIQHIIKNGRKKFIAKSPNILVNLITRQQLLAQETAKRLAELAVMPEEQKSETFAGAESYVANEFELLNNTEDNNQLLIIGGKGDHFAAEMGEGLKQYEKIRVQKKIIIRYIGSQEQKEELENLKKSRKYFEYKILPGLFTGLVNTNIWPETINFNIYGSPVTSFVVYNKKIAQGYHQFFEVLWKMAS